MNVVLIIWDAVRADHTFLLNYHRDTTPFLKSLASESYLFPHAITQGYWSLPSITSIFTGKYPSQHQVTMQNAYENRTCPMHKHNKMVTENLKELGYSTWGFVDDDWLNPQTGFTRGFDFYKSYPAPCGLGRGIKVVEDIKSTFKPEKPFFLFVNLLDTHNPYTVPGEFQIWAKARNINTDVNRIFVGGAVNDWGETEWGQLRDRYDEGILYEDYVTGELWKWLNSQGYLDDTIFIVLGDHGEYLGEHNLYHHTCAFYDELLRVMLVIWCPSQPGPVWIGGQFETRRIYDLILGIAQRNQLEITTNHFALSECPTPKNIMAVFRLVKADYDNPHLFSAKLCVRTKEWKLIMNSRVGDELYDLVNDPKETTNLYINDNTKEIRESLDFMKRVGVL